jgi:hypothetical protein
MKNPRKGEAFRDFIRTWINNQALPGELWVWVRRGENCDRSKRGLVY